MINTFKQLSFTTKKRLVLVAIMLMIVVIYSINDYHKRHRYDNDYEPEYVEPYSDLPYASVTINRIYTSGPMYTESQRGHLIFIDYINNSCNFYNKIIFKVKIITTDGRTLYEYVSPVDSVPPNSSNSVYKDVDYHIYALECEWVKIYTQTGYGER